MTQKPQEERYSAVLALARALSLDDQTRLSRELAPTPGTGPDPAEVIPLTEAARMLDVSLTLLRVQARKGKLNAYKQGRDWFTTRGDLHHYAIAKNQERRGNHKPIPAWYVAPTGMDATPKGE